MKKTIDTRICEVTVYDDQALVTRRGVVQLTGEEHELVIAQLPITLVSESVRARSVGTVGVRLSGVRTERTSTSKANVQEIAQLTQEIEQVEEQKRQAQDCLILLNLQRTFVKNLSTQYLERLTRFQNTEEMNLNKLSELLDFVGQRWSEFSNAIAQQEKEQKQLDKQLETLHQQLQQLSTLHSQESFSIIVTLEPSAAGEFELEVSYFVHQVSWVPLYDLRLSATSQRINLSYLGQVQQSSGEDWLDAALTLSTAKPELGTLPSTLTPWYIDVQYANEARQRAKVITEFDRMQPKTFSTNMPFPGMAPTPEPKRDAELERLKAQMGMGEVSKPGSIVTFEVSSRGNIPSDGATHKTTIFNEDYPCRAQYIAMPRIWSLPYLQITIANPLNAVTLLPGKANIFRDNTFVGTTQLENIAPGEEFKLNLGMDEGLKIDRVLVERQVDKSLVANQRRTTYAYRLVITNLRELQADLTLTEQLPVSCNEQIKVNLTCTNPEIQTDEMGRLEWSLTLLPQSKQELYYQFTVEHPAELTIVGLDI